MSLPRPDATPTRKADPRMAVDVEFVVDDGLPAAAAWDESRIAELVQAILGREFPAGGQYALSVHLVADETIRAMNAAHRGIDTPTDVLSFPLGDAPPDEPFVLPPGQPTHLGDVVVCYPRALEQAAEYGHAPEREIAYLVAHGVLHVLGYDHELDAERRRMRQREEEALGPLGFTR